MLVTLRVVAERNIELGADFFSIGRDDIAVTDLFGPAVAVVRRDTIAMGRPAAELLLSRLRNGGRASDIFPPTELAARPSCGRL